MMRPRRRRNGEIAASIEAARQASEESAGRLTETRELLATQKEHARNERVTIIEALRKMRAANNLAGMILDTVERQAGGGDEHSGEGRA